MMKHTLTGGQAVIDTLTANGIDTVFGIPGGHSFPVYAALAQARGLRHVLGRHEQGLGFMADGYARASGRIAAVSLTSGPAVGNISTALGEATTDTSPVLVIASTPAAAQVGKNRFGLHDLNDSLDLARVVARYAEHAASVEEISPKLAGLIGKLRYERPGGAYLQVPADVLAAQAEVEITCAPVQERREPAVREVTQAVELLRQAERPLIIAGTGALLSGAGEVIRRLAERLGAVVSTTVLARGLISGDLPYVIFPDGATPTEVDEVYTRADVVLALGTMFKQEDTANWNIRFGGKLIHVDIDAAEFGRSYRADVTIQADARATCEVFLSALYRPQPAGPEWAAYAQARQQTRLQSRRNRQGPDMAFAEEFRQVVPRDVMVFADRCNIGYWLFRCQPFYEPRTFHYPLGYGGLGGALPQAIGAKIACPERKVLCVIGDGGIQFTLSELAVAAQEQTPVTLVVSNNRCYGAIRAGLARNYNGLNFGTELLNPDFGKIAEAYGIPFLRITDRAQFLQSLSGELAHPRLCLIEFVNDIVDP
jgi:thiamine pyrophosphate-dependent acetolactate synthase large subunit-like protein